ncbi:hypothetical protein [Aneurinibacillus aneurinilyticus]|uniref:Uncharacterized protein n=1 Tax=Aneurinibacillus aneurinilyticus TaxID=1391 RepID=A0A848D1F1_ANEAE|nr:hypothetical protein [Aneurinibacillus aneurinilyticus]NMF01486.1 hypothetical protein [Aneurinibacillus aneurinilyticus]
MAYNKQTWKDEIPDLTKPIKDASGKQKTDPQTGRPLYELVQEGTRITSARLNHAEQGIEDAHILIEQLAKEWGGSFVASPNGTTGFQFTVSGLTVSWTAGVGYVAGRRFDVAAGSLTLNPTQGQYIYLDTDGVVKRTTSQTTANAGLLLWYFATDASKVITSTDRRRTITPDSFVRREEVVLKEQGKGLSTNDYSNEEKAKVQDHDQRLTVIEDEMGEAAPIPATLKPGIQTITADSTTPFNVSSIKGRTLINLLGRDGNCEDVSKWTVFSASTALDNVNKVQGDNGIKVTISNNYGTIQNIAPPTIKNSDSAYYVFLAEVKRLNCSKIDIAISDNYLGEQSTSTTNFSTLWTKVTGSFLSGKTLQVRFFGTNGQSGYVDAIRLYEITAAEYAALDSMTPEQITAKYPYVDDVKPVRNPYAIRYGKNLLPPFTEWNLPYHSEVIDTYTVKVKLDGNTTGDPHIFVNVIPGQTYTLSVASITKTNTNDKPRISYNFVNADGTLRAPEYGVDNKPIQITVPNDVAKVKFYLNNNGLISTNIFEKPMLNIGDTALPFEPQNNDYVFYDVSLHSNVDGTVRDELFYRDGQPRKLEKFRDVVLDGSFISKLTLISVASPSGYKSIRWNANGLINAASKTGLNMCTKYDGTILKPWQSNEVPDEIWVNDSSTEFYLTVPNKDSGWGENYAPSEDEIKAYFNGWKIYTDGQAPETGSYTGTGTRRWCKITKVGIAQTGDTTYILPTASYEGYTPYRLIYQLAQPVEVPVTSEGKITLHEGTNVLEVGTGVVIREATKPFYIANEKLYVISNTTDAKSKLKYMSDRIFSVYKNEIRDLTVKRTQAGTPNGKEQATIDEVNYDPNAAYSVTYLVLDRYAFTAPLINLQGEYAKTVAGVLALEAKNAADVETRVSVVENFMGSLANKINTGKYNVRISNSGLWEYNDGTGWKGMSAIKSVQRGQASIKGGESINVTINTVNRQKSVLILTGQSTTGGGSGTGTGTSVGDLIRAELISDNTIYFITEFGINRVFNIAWQVIEYV